MAVLESIASQASHATLTLSPLILSSIFYMIYRTFFDPLSHIPGPLICRLTSLWAWTHSYLGDESRQIDALHKKYGPVIRITPNEVVFAEGEALAPIYSERGGFLKSQTYGNFDSDGHPTIFSVLDPAHRAQRSKAVMPMFSTGALRSRSDAIEGCIDQFVRRLQHDIDASRRKAKETGRSSPVNVLNLARGLAIDAASSYLFGKSYGGCNEKTTKLSASSYVDSIRLYPPTVEEAVSQEKVDNFTMPLVQDPPQRDLYQTRLRDAGISVEETDVQMKDVIFAGTDTTGTNFGMLLWSLAKHPEVYRKLQAEVAEAESTDPDYNHPSLPYLEAVVKETLRTSMANPTHFPRIVPPAGWTYTSPSTGQTYHIPGGTQVGLQCWTLHFNPDVFPEPHAFKPERWLNPTKEMLRDWFPFGLGPRQCIARNLAMLELTLATRAVARSGVMEGAKVVQEKIEVTEWFNAQIVGEKIELVWE
ncbi:Putative cytochrome P450 [Septoria linicola]|uniref:Cytochrome P450 n=1 Tax=Septoria linicola TaxID=215465 RepID=A0A9Q9B5Q2_9PEZI|nr:putative cytochrome P450 [Septoria linicola]USW57636.1 Putative cytochrome P450 [Septoria linicola]